jgi:DNA polymerase III delta prime subunit
MLAMASTHNILVAGGEHADRLAYAKDFAKYYLCSNRFGDVPCNECNNCQRVATSIHPNLLIIEPANSKEQELNQNEDDNHNVIKIDQVRSLIVENQKTSFEHGVSVFIITHMHNMTKAAANALLKIMEENSGQKIFIALAPSRKTILPTIASRLVCRFVQPAPIDTKVNETMHQKIMLISETKPSSRFPLCGQFSAEREGLLHELALLIVACHGLLRANLLSPKVGLALSEALHRAEKKLKKNQNARLVMEILVLREWPFLHR